MIRQGELLLHNSNSNYTYFEFPGKLLCKCTNKKSTEFFYAVIESLSSILTMLLCVPLGGGSFTGLL